MNQAEAEEINNDPEKLAKWKRAWDKARNGIIGLTYYSHPDLLNQTDTPATQHASAEEAIAEARKHADGWIVAKGDWQAAGRAGLLGSVEFYMPHYRDRSDAEVKSEIDGRAIHLVAEHVYRFID